jgi:hypothetical protein
MRKRKLKVEEVSEDVLRQVAQIIGEHSAAKKSLLDMEARRGRGEDPVCYQIGTSFVVTDRKNAKLLQE